MKLRLFALAAAIVCLSSATFGFNPFPGLHVSQNGVVQLGENNAPLLKKGILKVYDSAGHPIPLGEVTVGSTQSTRGLTITNRAGVFSVYSPFRCSELNPGAKCDEDRPQLGMAIVYTPRVPMPGQTVTFSADINWGTDTLPCRIDAEQGAGLSQFAYGPAESARCNSLFDNIDDSALTVDTPCRITRKGTGWHLETSTKVTEKHVVVVVIRFTPEYMKSVRDYKYYKPLDRSVFDKAPSGWCSSYSYSGAITEKDMVESTDWIAKNLKPFGFEYVQLDDGFQDGVHNWVKWNKKFPSGGKWMADYIHSKGMKAGIWLNPFTTNDSAMLAAHPDWFIHDAKGKVIGVFPSDYLFDCANPAVIDQWMKPLYKTLAIDYGYDYFKHDGQTDVVAAYAKHKFNEPVTDLVEPYRTGLKAIRDVIGPNRFILSCCCAPREGMGIIDGTRIGSDVGASWGGLHPAYQCTRDRVFMNNIGWIADPDVVCVRNPLTLDQAQVWVSFVALTGQVFMAGDWLQRLPEDRVELLRRVYPVAKIMPMDLYSLSDAQMNMMDLKVSKPFGSWDVVGLFNWTEKPKQVSISAQSLSLPENPMGYAVYDFWNKKYLGVMKGAQNIDIPPTGCRVLSVAALTDHPQVISTSRHITQGAMDLKAVKWDPRKGVLSGKSDIVGGDPYEIRIAVPTGYEVAVMDRYNANGASATGAKTALRYNTGFASITLLAGENREVDWHVTFTKKSK